MGLDISTYRTANFDKVMERKKKEQEIGQLGEDIWENDEATKDLAYEDMTDEDKKRLRDASHEVKVKAAKEAGLEYAEVGDDFTWYEFKNDDMEPIEEKSKVHPDHQLYKVGYFRSSYNEGGINHILNDRIGITLYNIFDYSDKDEDYYFKPDWKSVKEKTIKAKEDLKKAYDRSGNVHIMAIQNYGERNGEELPTDSSEALAMYQTELDRFNESKDKGFEVYHNYRGLYNFSDTPYKVRALIHGKDKYGFSESTTYVIYDGYDENNFYLDALDIIVETADLALSDPDNDYFVSWSA
jgi:hypothetical protein